MDFGKLKDIAKTATEKTVAGVSKANETRKKASQETKISVGNQTIRKTIDGKYIKNGDVSSGVKFHVGELNTKFLY